jgi:DDE superfamily endonuclease
METCTSPLARFRAALYHDVLGLRRDALFELTDAVLTDPGPSSLVRRTLNPCFRRGWASASDAVADGSLDVAALRRLWGAWLPPPPAHERPVWALDGTTWPRPAAKTSAERTWCRFVTGGQPQEGVVPGWEWQWLGAVMAGTASWVLPLSVERRGPHAGSPTTLAIRQLRATLAAQPDHAPRPIVVLDSHYDLGALAAADLTCDLLARLSARRRFFREPPPYAGFGAPRKHGPVFRTHDPATHGAPDQTLRQSDPARGWVQIDAWERLHAQAAPTAVLTVLRVTVGRLPRRTTPPAPLWLAWRGERLPADLSRVWRWYEQRFAIEHLFRFLKQALGWTAIGVRAPATAERWTHLVATAIWQLWLARAERRSARLPWERPTPSERATPGQVRRGFAGLLLEVGTPARSPRPRGKSPGRTAGAPSGRRQRYAIHRRSPPTVA